MTKTTPEQQTLLNRVTSARKAKIDWGLEFESRVRRMKEEESRDLAEALARAMWEAWKSGSPKVAIAAAYGTKDQATVNRILKEYDERQQQVAAQIAEYETQSVVFDILGDGGFLATLDKYTEIDHPKNIKDEVSTISDQVSWDLNAAGVPMGYTQNFAPKTPGYYEMSKIGGMSRLQERALAWAIEQGLTQGTEVVQTETTDKEEED